ncbi:MAG: ADP-ribosylglycohydrolase family protein [Candidatus Aminicenantes bacterium]|nr:ADP-ribosylglycohydrolase family protein [Candidatus Aminicenantes bacterium]
MTIEDRFVGTLLGTAVGDILGAGIEGWHRDDIHSNFGEVRDFMSTDHGYGCYTDDTEMTLALAQSIVKCREVEGQHCAQTYARFYNPWRGYGTGSRVVLEELKKGADYRKTGFLVFPEGSFGNGGAMRIAPVGLFGFHQSNEQLKKAVYEAVVCSHANPEGFDGAMIQAKAIALLVNENLNKWNPMSFLAKLFAVTSTNIMRRQLRYLKEVVQKGISEDEAVITIGNGIRASEAVVCTLLATIKYHKDPENAVIQAVNWGGDCDTIGAMTGAQMGALHGREWIPQRWLDNIENEIHGRDFIIRLGKQPFRVVIN